MNRLDLILFISIFDEGDKNRPLFKSSTVPKKKSSGRVTTFMQFLCVFLYSFVDFCGHLYQTNASILSNSYFYDLIKSHKCDDMIINYGHKKL